ncbi:MAG: DUF2306 domain-containing protein [Bacteroidota bacterium]
MKKILWFSLGILSLFFSFYPLKYFLADGPILLLRSKSVELLASYAYNFSFYMHITFGGIALMIGWLQFNKAFREKYTRLHRNIGKVYIGSVLMSGPFGFYIAFFATGGLSPMLGFSIGALLWITITYLAYDKIRKGDIEAHKNLMLYSYAGTFGAVTLRLWLPLLILLMGSFVEAYRIVAWLSWLPNVLIIYLVINWNSLPIIRQKRPSLAEQKSV